MIIILRLRILVVLSFLLQCINLSSQSYWSNRYDLDRGNDYGEQLIEYNGRLLVLVKALCEINTRFCGGILCVDQNDSLMWKIVFYDTIETNYVEAMTIHRDTIVLNMNYVGIEGKNYTLAFLDSSGAEVRRMDYFHPGLPGKHWARGIESSQDRIFVSFAARNDLQFPAREIIRAFDNTWTMLWEVSVPNTFPWPLWCDAQATSDGGVVALYSSWENGIRRMATVEKYDPDGIMEWQTPLPHIGGFASAWVRLDNHPDGGYVGIWHFDTAQIHITDIPTIVFKLNASGDIEWEKMNLTDQVWLYDIFSARNGDIVGCGIAENWLWGDTVPKYHVGYVVRFNTEGETLWNRKIADETEGADFWELYSGIELLNGDLAFTGRIDDTIFGAPDDATPVNVWVLKLDSMGCLSPGCGEWQNIVTSVKEVERNTSEFIVYPNPASDYVLIGARLGAHVRNGKYNAFLFDMSGHILSTRSFDPYRITEIDIGALPYGNYVLTVWKDGLLVQSEKLQIR